MGCKATNRLPKVTQGLQLEKFHREDKKRATNWLPTRTLEKFHREDKKSRSRGNPGSQQLFIFI
jgi:hypothetical protein